MKRDIKKKVSKTIILLVNSVVTAILLLSCKNSDRINLGQENAVWIESVYLRGYHPSNLTGLADEDLISLAETLEKNNIKYAYLFAGPFNKEGHLPEYAFSDTAIQSVQALKKLYPKIIILPWVGGIQDKTVYLNDSIWVRNALADSKKLVQRLSVNGLHFDFEFILKGDTFLDRAEAREGSSDEKSYGINVNEFHRKFRELMPNSFVSSVVVATSPETKPWKRKTTINELKVLTKYVNQLSFLYYDTYINSQTEFKKNCRYLLRDIQNLKRTNSSLNVQYLVAIGTFINVPELQKFRNLDIENIPNTLKTIKSCLLQVSPNEQLVDGISVYCNWETDEAEWDQIRENWTGQNH